MRKTLLAVALCLLMVAEMHAQSKTITNQQQVWLAYFNQSRFSKRWGAWLDLQLRTKDDFFDGLSQSIVRGGITYYLNDATKITAGDAWVSHFPADNHKKITQPEHRPWQQIQWHTNYSRVKTMQWLRLEERFRRNVLNDSTLADGSSFNFRVRYNFLLQVPLTKAKIQKGDWSFILNNEIHLNFGKSIVYNTFDQNRLFLGFAYYVTTSDNLQFGYMNVYQQGANGSNYRSLHVGRVSYFHNVDWRRR